MNFSEAILESSAATRLCDIAKNIEEKRKLKFFTDDIRELMDILLDNAELDFIIFKISADVQIPKDVMTLIDRIAI